MILHLIQTLISVRRLFFWARFDESMYIWRKLWYNSYCIIESVPQTCLVNYINSIWSVKIIQSRLNSITAYVPRMLFFPTKLFTFVANYDTIILSEWWISFFNMKFLLMLNMDAFPASIFFDESVYFIYGKWYNSLCWYAILFIKSY